MPWESKASQAAWTTKKVLQAAKHLNEVGINKREVSYDKHYSIREMYNKLRGDFPKVTWRQLTCNNQGCPKWLFIMYLAIQNRLYTRDRLSKRGVITCQTCSLCEIVLESHQHLFFECIYSETVWLLLAWQGINRQAQGWEDEITWAITHTNGRQAQAETYRTTLAAAIYQIWMERNYRTF